MSKREIPLPVAIGVIIALILVVVAFFWRQTSPPTESTLKSWAPYPQIPAQGSTQNSPR